MPPRIFGRRALCPCDEHQELLGNLGERRLAGVRGEAVPRLPSAGLWSGVGPGRDRTGPLPERTCGAEGRGFNTRVSGDRPLHALPAVHRSRNRKSARPQTLILKGQGRRRPPRCSALCRNSWLCSLSHNADRQTAYPVWLIGGSQLAGRATSSVTALAAGLLTPANG